MKKPAAKDNSHQHYGPNNPEPPAFKENTSSPEPDGLEAASEYIEGKFFTSKHK